MVSLCAYSMGHHQHHKFTNLIRGMVDEELEIVLKTRKFDKSVFLAYWRKMALKLKSLLS